MGKVFKSVGKIAGKVASIAGPVASIAGMATGNPAIMAIGAAASRVAQVAAPVAAIAGALGGSGSGGSGSTPTSTAQGNVANGAYYDPFANSRGIYANRLNTLMSASPTEASKLVTDSPGYAGGLQAGEREVAAGLAKSGQVASGAEQIAYGNLGQDYFRKSYQDLYNEYSTLSGATNQPLNMASANQLGANQARLQDQATAQGLGSLANLFTSTSPTTAPSPSYTSSPGGYAPGATSYTPMNTSIGMGNYQAPTNYGGGTVGPTWA